MKQRSSRNVVILSVSMIFSSALIAGGIAYAAGETITACVKKSNGATRIISGKMKCTKSERSVTWGSEGAQGNAGATGATGAAGATGSAGTNGTNGVSSILEKSGSSSSVLMNGVATVMTASVPAGKYSFHFSGDVGLFNNNSPTTKTRYLACLISTWSDAATALGSPRASNALLPTLGSIDYLRAGFDPVGASLALSGMQTYSITGVVNLATNTDIYVQCQTEASDTTNSGQLIMIEHSKLVLIKTDSLTTIN